MSQQYPPQAPFSTPVQYASQPRRSSTALKVTLGISVIVLILAIGLIAFSLVKAGKLNAIFPSTPDGYLSSGPDDVEWITWTEKNGSLTGQWLGDTVQNGKANYVTFPITGTRNGDQITITIQAGIVNMPATGTIQGNTLQLHISLDGKTKGVTLQGASTDAYTTALKLFQQHHPS